MGGSEHHGHHGRCGGGGRGFRGFGRRGFPQREELADRLERYREHLERELENVRDLLDRLGGDARPEGTAQV